MALNTLAVNTALVVDVGYTECLVTPVIEGVTVLNIVQFHALGGKAIHERIRSDLLACKAAVSRAGQEFAFDKSAVACLSESEIEDIKVRTCFVASYTRGQQLIEDKVKGISSTSCPPDVLYPLHGRDVLKIPGFVRESAFQVMFEMMGNEATIATMILDALSLAPIDCRRSLAANLVLIGGGTMSPGFRKRVSDELHGLVDVNPEYKRLIRFKEFKMHDLPCPANYASWLGSAIYASTDAILSKTITSKEFDQTRGAVMSDWVHWWPATRPPRLAYG